MDSSLDQRAEWAEHTVRVAMESFPLSRPPVIQWTNFRTTAGRAVFSTQTIQLSRHVLESRDQVVETVLHEYAHLLAVERHGRRAANHGPGWQKAMRDLGCDPKVTHQYACQRNQSRQLVVYVCHLCKAEFKRRRRLPTGRKYLHRGCGGEIKLVAVAALTNESHLS